MWGNRFAVLVLAGLLSATATSLEIESIEVLDLGTLPGDRESIAADINDDGDIVGRSYTEGEGSSKAFSYIDERLEQLVTPGGKDGAAAHAINNSGVVVGYATQGRFVDRAVIWQRNRPVMLEPDSDLSDRTAATDINDDGVVIGSMGLAAVYWPSPFSRPSSYQQILDPSIEGGPHAITALAINARGHIVGTNDRRDSAFYYEGGTYRGLRGDSLQDDRASDINAAGVIVGSVAIERTTEPRLVYRAALWANKDASYQDLGVLGGNNSRATGINDRGIVVGSSDSDSGSQVAFIWHEDFGMQALPSLGGERSVATAINRFGHVVGASETEDGTLHATLWKITYNPRIRIPIFSLDEIACIPFVNCPSPFFSVLLLVTIPILALGIFAALRWRRVK